MSNPAVQFQDVTRTFGRNLVLSGVDFEVLKGEHVLLTGPSGGGKSTILRIIAGLDVPSSGRVFLSVCLASMEKRIMIPAGRRDLVMVFQDLGLWPNLSVSANVRVGLAGQSLTGAERKSRVGQLIRDCALTGLEKRKPGSLSAGEQQRLALARALAPEPQLLLLDEPFAALDLSLREELFALITLQVKQRNMTVITVSHQPSDALGLQVDRLLILEEGRIVESLPAVEIMFASVKSLTLQAWRRQLERTCLPNACGVAGAQQPGFE